MNRGSVASFIGRQHSGGPASRSQQKLLIGPWLHGPQVARVGELEYPASCNWDITRSMLAWFAHHLKGVHTEAAGPEAEAGVEEEATVQYFNMGACGEIDAPGNEWRTATDFPLAAAVETDYILYAGATENTGIPQRNSFATGKGVLDWSGGQAVRGKGALTTAGDSRPGLKPKAADLVHATEWRSDPNRPVQLGETVGFAPGARDQRVYEAYGDDVALFSTVCMSVCCGTISRTI
jgi:predicted acyl esterase